jgi:5'-nucleotidase
MQTRPRLLLLAALFAFASCRTTTPLPPRATGPVHVVIVSTTDLHGWFNGHDDPVVKTGGTAQYGGLAVFSGYLRNLRAANPGRVVLVDSGDLFQGTLESNIFEGEPVVKGYNALGYTAAAVGNHEFDYGPVGPDSVAHSPDQDELGALKKNAADAKFPFLSANMVEKATGRTPSWAKPYTIVNVDGARIGIIGLSTPDTPNVTTPANVIKLAFNDPVAATIEAARALRAAGADAVVVIAHIGGRCTDLHDPNDISSCDLSQEAMRYLNALPEKTIDAYFAGHTHSEIRQYFKGVPAVEAGSFSRIFGTIDLWVDPAAHNVVRSEIRPNTPICAAVYGATVACDPRAAESGAPLTPRQFEGAPVTRDAALDALFKPYLDQVAAKRAEPTGIRTASPVKRNYSHESALGNLLADALRASVPGADVAFVNSGGLRADLRAGDLHYSDIFEVAPFDNYAATVDLTGAQLREILQLTTASGRGLLQASGLRYTFDLAKDADKPVAERRRLVSATLADGSPLVDDKVYKVVVPDFLAAGGDGWMPVIKEVPSGGIHVYAERPPLREIFIEQLRKFPQPLDPKVEGRITILNDKAAERD